MIKATYNYIPVIIILTFLFSFNVQAQISSNADAVTSTQYSGGLTQDQIFIFCADKGETKASLTATGSLIGTINYEWQKYDSVSGIFQTYISQSDGGSSSSITSLEDGGYRVIISNGTKTETYTAWVFNNYYEVSAEITESNCEYFTLNGNYESPTLTYYDLNSNQPLEVSKTIGIKWKNGDETVSSMLSPSVYDPPTSDTKYTLNITDNFGCSGQADVTYNSIVTEAAFSVSESEGEAPLKVTFTNESENGTSGKYEWFFYKDLDVIDKEIEKNGESDSIDFKAYDDDLTYTYEKSGKYKVKLVSKHVSDLCNCTCTDTFYLSGYIEVDTSFVSAPNFFTPNGDGSNDNFIVKFWSVKNIKISIFNRWGKRVHYWEDSNVEGFENTVDSETASVWDGKIGGKMASPGVYYYVVEARGRDDKKRWSHGFVHLFRGK